MEPQSKDQHDHEMLIENFASRAPDPAKSGRPRLRVPVTEQDVSARTFGAFVTQPYLEQPRSREPARVADRCLALEREERRSARSDTVPSHVAGRRGGER